MPASARNGKALMSEKKRKLVPTPRFERSSKRYVGRDARRQNCIMETLRRMEANLYDPRLKTHPLTGTLAGYYASSCGYDCRVIYSLELDTKSKAEKIMLYSVGTHDTVY